MANETILVVRKPIEGYVAAIISERELAINIGSHHGVMRGMKFNVLGPPTEIVDPQTEEKLDSIHRDKVRVMAERVSPKFTVCKTYRTFRTGGGSLSAGAGLAKLFEPLRTERETLRADHSDYVPELSEEESIVKKGDTIVQILDEDSMTIQDAETVLRNAILTGSLDKALVEGTVPNWKQAEAELEEARRATQDREEKIDAALKRYNSSSMELTRLLNKVRRDEADE